MHNPAQTKQLPVSVMAAWPIKTDFEDKCACFYKGFRISLVEVAHVLVKVEQREECGVEPYRQSVVL
jgi:hypothetical protein